MIAKVKKQSLMLVALYLGWSGYGAVQPEEEAALDLSVPEPLPEVVDENMPLRLAAEEVAKLIDPFRMGEMKVAPVEDDLGDGPIMAENDEEDSTILELNSTMRLPSGAIAFINKRRIAVGDKILNIANGPSPILKSVRGPMIEIEYLDEVYTLDTHSMPRLQLKPGSAVILAPALEEGNPMPDPAAEAGGAAASGVGP